MAKIIQPLIFAFQFLTRVPIPYSGPADEHIARRALMLFPLVGFLIGCLLYAAVKILAIFPAFSPLITALILITLETALTGAFHLDGLADTFDAFLSAGKSVEEKLAIMKDSRIGVMGCVALILALFLKTALLARLLELQIDWAIVIYPTAGRWAQVVGYVFSPYVRAGGTGELFSKHANSTTLFSASLLLTPFLFIHGFPVAMLLLVMFLWLYRRYVHRQIGGITGDVLGSITVLAELVVVIGMVLTAHGE